MSLFRIRKGFYSSITCVIVRRNTETDTHRGEHCVRTHTERRQPGDGRDDEWSYAALSQEQQGFPPPP